MSTAAFENLQSSGGTVPTETLRRGSAKAWMNLNGTGTIAIRDSFNTSSATDNGVGDYTENFTSAFANTNYGPVVTATRHTSTILDYDYRPSLAGINFMLTGSVRGFLALTTGVANVADAPAFIFSCNG